MKKWPGPRISRHGEIACDLGNKSMPPDRSSPRPCLLYRAEALEPRILLSGYGFTADTSFVPAPYGEKPNAVVVDASGNIFGTMSSGGANNHGAVFEIPHGTTSVVTVAAFNADTPYPAGLAIDSRGDLFGVSYPQVNYPVDRLFEIVAGSGVVTTLASFSTGVGYPVVESSGNVLLASAGGIVEVNPATGTVTTLADYSGITPSNTELGSKRFTVD
jgi:hypothetical protein